MFARAISFVHVKMSGTILDKVNNKSGSVDCNNKMQITHFVVPSISASRNDENSNSNIDERSCKGQFGWFTLGNGHIPYIFRNDERYCSVRMVELSALNSFLHFLNKDIYNCTNIRSYYITPAEARLLNQINCLHCDSHYGRDLFTEKDSLVKVNDAEEFYQFLVVCYSKLLSGKAEGGSRLGFVIINKESVVPYIVFKGEKYVPLFYFEGEIDQLKLKSYKFEGWDLCYLKFCCKVQGIRNQLFAHDTCYGINLDDIKIYFPPETTFEEYWPKKTVDVEKLLTNKSQTSIGEWTKHPTAPPICTALPQANSTAPTQTIYKYNTPYPAPGTSHGATDMRTYTTKTTIYNYMSLT